MQQILYRARLAFIVGIQAGIILTALALAYVLRFDFDIPAVFAERLLALLPVALLLKLAIFWQQGLFRGWWRYVSMADLVALLKANFLASLALIAWAFFAYRLENVPRSALLLDGMICFGLMCGVRFLTRALRENYLPVPLPSQRRPEARRLLIIGAGEAGQAIAREVRTNTALHMTLVGFVDDDPQKAKGQFQGHRLLGPVRDLSLICADRQVDEILIAIPSITGKQLQPIVDACMATGLPYKILPGTGALIDGRVSVQQVRDVSLEDLLGREAVRIDTASINAYLKGKRVLVTGAGGSIGSEICRQAARFEPEQLLLFDSAETPLFFIERELRESRPAQLLVPVIGDIRNPARVAAVFAQYRPDVVFHAAAYKHVPMMEANPAEAINNNVRGTRILADAADASGVRHFVMISTDKAVRPTNVMGASKRAAEIYVQNLARRSRTHFVTVRFGNVLGSNGSVVPIFREQIARGGPVTVTHPDITRFFMTIPEAVQLVLQAGSMGKGGEIFLLDMGEPVKILHLAEEMIRLSGFEPYEGIDIRFVGLRPGEKLYEELLLADEGIAATSHDKIKVATAVAYGEQGLAEGLEQLFQAAKRMDVPAVIANLRRLVPEYAPEKAGAGDQSSVAPTTNQTVKE